MNINGATSNDHPESRLYLLIFLICLAFAIFFIFTHLGKTAFWLDEAAAANTISHSFRNLASVAINDNDSLLYIFSLKIWALIFGFSEVTLRSFSAFWGLAVIALLYWIGFSIFNDRRRGLLASALGSVNYFLIWYARQNRPNTMAVFAGILSYFFLVRLLKKASPSNYIGFVISATAGMYIHPWFPLIFLAEVLIVFYLRRKADHFRGVVMVMIGVAILSLPALLISFHARALGASKWISPPQLSFLPQAFNYLVYGSGFIFWPALAISIFIILFFRSKKTEIENLNTISSMNLDISLIFYILVPLLSAFFISFWSPVFVPGRYEIIILPALLLLATDFWIKTFSHKIIIILMVILLVLTWNQVAANYNEVNSYLSDDKKVATQILSQYREGDVIIATDLSYATLYYYFNQLQSNGKRLDFVSYPSEISQHPGWENLVSEVERKDEMRAEAAALVQRLADSRPDIKIFIIYIDRNPINPILVEELSKKFRQIENQIPPLPREMGFDRILIFNR